MKLKLRSQDSGSRFGGWDKAELVVKRIILLSGPIASGKSTLAKKLSKHFNTTTVQTRKLLQRTLVHGNSSGRSELQAEGERLDRITGGRWVYDEIVQHLRDIPTDTTVVVDSVRILNQIHTIREAYGTVVLHIHLTASVGILEERHNSRLVGISGGEKDLTHQVASSNHIERLIEELKASADIVIDTTKCSVKAVLFRVAGHLELSVKRGEMRDDSTLCSGHQCSIKASEAFDFGK